MTVVDLATRRRDKIGGSEAASACGVDPFRSRIMLWAEKTGRIERPETEAMKWGKLLEPVVFAGLERQGYDVMPAPDGEWSHDDRVPRGLARVSRRRSAIRTAHRAA